MIKETEIMIDITSRNITYYKNKGYSCVNGDVILVKIEDVNNSCKKNITAICECGAEISMRYEKYLINKNRCGFYGCKKCSNKKRIILNQERYGVDNTSQLQEVKLKREKTNLERYGEKTNLLCESNKEKIRLTNLKKYGVEKILTSPLIREKIKDTNIKKWGVNSYSKTSEFKALLSKKHNSIEKYQTLIGNNFKIIDYIDYVFTISGCDKNHIFNIKIKNLYARLCDKLPICTVCYPISEQTSIKEKEIVKWIKELGVDYIENDREILVGKELDIYIPSKNIAIEFNGLYWHSEFFKDKNYHIDKSIMCQEKGVGLIHIWEDEWIFKQDIVKSIIKNRLGLIDDKIYARDCVVKSVDDSKIVRQFLDDNHIQGYCQSTIKLGLFHNEKLVSLMSFGKRLIKKNIEFELLRFCNILNTNVVGAASKLFNYFLKNYSFTELISYSDFRMFDGMLYQTLGFSKQHLSKPEYFWCKDIERKHRFNFNKQKLIAEGYDSNKTEVEIMHSRDYYRVYGCGQYKWLFKKYI